jgi:spermidine synthase
MLIVPPTFLMGFSFPVLQRIVQTDFARLGRRVGWLLVANIAGSVIGTVLTGWLALNLLGTAATIEALVGLCGGFLLTAIAFFWHARTVPLGRPMLTTLAAALMTVVFALIATHAMLPDAQTLWAGLHGTTGNRMIFGEDASGLSLLRLEPGRNEIRTTVFVNGVGQSSIPYGDIHTALGMVPAFVHPNPREVLIIGLGSGDTVYGVAGRAEIETITCVEIIKPQLQGLQRLRSRHPYRGLVGLLDDRRIEHIAGDGRIFLMQSGRKFDIIEADALRPSSAYSGNLYSDAYFELVRSRLRPRGLAATWSPTGRVHNAFVRVFPYVVSVPSILLGSNEPIEFDRAAIAIRLSDPRGSEHYSRAGIDASRLMEQYIKNPVRYMPDFDRRALVDFNTDLFPKDEFDLTIQR